MQMDYANRPTWDSYYMALTFVIAQRSIDPNTKHGTVVVGEGNEILSIGYNSPPRGCIDGDIPLESPEKYIYMIHSEDNAIINAARIGVSLKNSTFYITGHPCARCFRSIVNAGAKRILYGPISSKCIDEEDVLAIDKMRRHQHLTIGTGCIKLEQYTENDAIEILKNSQEYILRKTSENDKK